MPRIWTEVESHESWPIYQEVGLEALSDTSKAGEVSRRYALAGFLSYEKDTMVGYLVGGCNHVLFFIIYGKILPIDYYFSRWLKPPNSYV